MRFNGIAYCNFRTESDYYVRIVLRVQFTISRQCSIQPSKFDHVIRNTSTNTLGMVFWKFCPCLSTAWNWHVNKWDRKTTKKFTFHIIARRWYSIISVDMRGKKNVSKTSMTCFQKDSEDFENKKWHFFWKGSSLPSTRHTALREIFIWQ